jgi:hypothetical protein
MQATPWRSGAFLAYGVPRAMCRIVLIANHLRMTLWLFPGAMRVAFKLQKKTRNQLCGRVQRWTLPGRVARRCHLSHTIATEFLSQRWCDSAEPSDSASRAAVPRRILLMEQQDWSVQLASQSTLRLRVAAPDEAGSPQKGVLWTSIFSKISVPMAISLHVRLARLREPQRPQFVYPSQ